MRRTLQGIDEGLPAPLAREPVKVVCSDDHHFFTAMHGDVLRPFLFRASHDLAESRLGLLQLPLPWSRAA
jgi:hypothetical protein